jgi:hypothetical protein
VVKQRLAAEHHLRREARLDAASRLTARPIEGRELTPGEFTLLLELLDRGLHQRPPEPEFKVEVEAEGVRLIIATADEPTRIVTPVGVLAFTGIELEVLRP